MARPHVVLIHGGPGAPGSMRKLGAALADAFEVSEPVQRGSGGAPLTVARHVADLREHIGDRRPALVGSSWGAMLALACAAAHPGCAGRVVLVGCGTFDTHARARLKATLEERLGPRGRRALAAATTMDEVAALVEPAYVFDPLEPVGGDGCDDRANAETWADMLRLQEEGVYPAAFSAVESPVLMLHGAYDPHPGPMIRDSLAPHVKQLEYREWERCGHYPWIERHARDGFLAVLRGWLSETRPA